MHQGRCDTIEPAVNDLLRLTLQLRVRDPTGRQLYQRFPASLELQFKQHTDDAIVVILDLRNQLFSAAQYDWFQPLDDGWILEANIVRSGMLEAGLNPPRAQDVAQLLKPDLVADIVENNSQDGTLHGRNRRAARHGSPCPQAVAKIVREPEPWVELRKVV